MLRSLVEILAFAKISPVSDAHPFFRTVGDDRLGKAYRARMVQGNRKPEGGFLDRRGGEWVVLPASAVLRVEHAKLPADVLGYVMNPAYRPTWHLQHHRCWIRRTDNDNEWVDEIRLDASSAPAGDWSEGILVLTGSVPGKRGEFVFLNSVAEAEPVVVPLAVWERFHDEDQISQWQEKTFPVDQPFPGARKRPGDLRSGDPVFFLRDEDGTPDGQAAVAFFGRARMFRLPYDLSLADLVPQELRGLPEDRLDLAEAMFGRVRPAPAVKGRVFVEDAVAVGDRTDWYEDVLVPKILSSPKPTTYRHYLTQNGSGAEFTYLDEDRDRTVARGSKLYWHRWNEQFTQLAAAPEQGRILGGLDREPEQHRQYTRMRPVKAGVVLRGRIRFENLAAEELGALLWALHLRKGCAHKLGMGKPLGLGSVRIASAVSLVDRKKRYATWGSSGITGVDDAATATDHCLRRFADRVLTHARKSGETMHQDKAGLDAIARLDALFLLLGWKGPGHERTEAMELEGFRQRGVLPTPHRVSEQREPAWRQPETSPQQTSPQQERRDGAGRRPAARPGRATSSGGPSVRPSPPATVASRWEALEEKTKKNGWIFRLSDGTTGVLHPQSRVPPDLSPGRTYDMARVADGSPHCQLSWVDPEAPPPGPVKAATPSQRRRPR
jgi:CRISPR-associated protein (TIGR03986 family)